MRAWGSGFEKEENGPCGADPLGPALCLCWLVTSLPFLLLRYSFQDYLQPWPQCSCKLQILFSLFFFLSHSLPSFLVRGAVYIWHCLLKLQPRFIGFTQWRENNHSILRQDLAEGEFRCSGDISAKHETSCHHLFILMKKHIKGELLKTIIMVTMSQKKDYFKSSLCTFYF